MFLYVCLCLIVSTIFFKLMLSFSHNIVHSSIKAIFTALKEFSMVFAISVAVIFSNSVKGYLLELIIFLENFTFSF